MPDVGDLLRWPGHGTYRVVHLGCAVGLGRSCKHADHGPVAALRLDPRTQKVLSVHTSPLTECIPSGQCEPVAPINKEPQP